MKNCPKCISKKPVSEFGKNKNSKDGLSCWCRSCCSENGKRAYNKSKEKVLAYQKQYRLENPEKVRATKKLWKAKNKEKVTDINRWSKRKTAYGITKDQFFEMLENQNHTCAICDRAVGVSSCVDHCHDTGIVRGILCDPCNNAIGVLGDNLAGVMRAVNYLKEAHNGQETA